MSDDLELEKTTAEYGRDAEILAQALLALKTKEELASMLALEIITKQIEEDLKAVYEPKLAAMKADRERLERASKDDSEKMLSKYLDKYIVAQGTLAEMNAKNKQKSMKAAQKSAHNRSESFGKDQVMIEYFTLRDAGYFNKRGSKTAFDKAMAQKHGLEPGTVEAWRLAIQRYIDSLPDE
ncbi:hypothetical protein D3C85_907540 [compost metagenome]